MARAVVALAMASISTVMLACTQPPREALPATFLENTAAAAPSLAPPAASVPSGLSVVPAGDATWLPSHCEDTPLAGIGALGWPAVVDAAGSRTALVASAGNPARLELRRWDATGNLQWSVPLTNVSHHLPLPQPVHALPGGDVLVVGSFTGALAVDRFRLKTTTGADGKPRHVGFALRVGPRAEVRWLERLGDESAIHTRIVGVAVHPDGRATVGVVSDDTSQTTTLGERGRIVSVVQDGLVSVRALADGGFISASTRAKPVLKSVIEHRTDKGFFRSRLELFGVAVAGAVPAPEQSMWLLIFAPNDDRDRFRERLSSQLGVTLGDDLSSRVVVRVDRSGTARAAHESVVDEGDLLLPSHDGGVILLRNHGHEPRAQPLAYLTADGVWHRAPRADAPSAPTTVALFTAPDGVRACLDDPAGR